MPEKILEVSGLKISFHTRNEVIPAVDDISFHIKAGETVGMVGESGCGKSVTALNIIRLVPIPPGKIESGRILFQGEELLHKTSSEMRRIRGKKISMIFQEPMTSLNPVYSVGSQIAEAMRLHLKLSRRESIKRAVELLDLVGIPSPEKRVKEYPYQMSGGMRQRIMIAMAISCNPHLLIADEPTTALDVTIQAQILQLLEDLKQEYNMTIFIITHDLGVVAEMAQRVIVMYAGKIVETGPVRNILKDPMHPYTSGLLKSIPRIEKKEKQLSTIRGVVPNPAQFPPGCRFHPRCDYAWDICKTHEPPLLALNEERKVACWLRQKAGKREVIS